MVFYSADGDTKESQLSLINFEDGKTEKIIEWTDSDTFDEAWCDRGVIGRTLYTIQDQSLKQRDQDWDEKFHFWINIFNEY